MQNLCRDSLKSHAAGAIPDVGLAIQQVGNDLDTDLHDRNYRAVAGDVLGPLLTFGVGKTIRFVTGLITRATGFSPMSMVEVEFVSPSSTVTLLLPGLAN
jgi:hypothetical protein